MFNFILRKTNILIRVQINTAGHLKVIFKINTVQIFRLDVNLSHNKSEIKFNFKILLYIYVMCTQFTNFYIIQSEFILTYDVKYLLFT